MSRSARAGRGSHHRERLDAVYVATAVASAEAVYRAHRPARDVIEMRYAREFFALQVRFTERVAAVCALDLAEALFACTTFRSAFTLGGSADREHSVWHTYLRGLVCAADPAAWTFAFY